MKSINSTPPSFVKRMRRWFSRGIHRSFDSYARRSWLAQLALALLVSAVGFLFFFTTFFSCRSTENTRPVVNRYDVATTPVSYESGEESTTSNQYTLENTDSASWVITPYDAFVQMVNPSTIHNGTNLSSWERLGVVVLYLFGAFMLTGVIVTLLVNYVDTRRANWLKGDVEVNMAKPFILIIGGHRMVPRLWMELKDKKGPDGKPYQIVIQTKRVAERLRRELQSLGGDLAERVTIKNGDRTSDLDIRELEPHLAQEIYIIGEDSYLDGDNHDANSMQCLNLLEKWIGEEHRQSDAGTCKTECHVMFEYQASSKIFQYTDLDLRWIEFIPFNLYEQWAEEVLVAPYEHTRPMDALPYLPLTGNDASCFAEGRKRVHIVIVGMTKMGTMFGAKAAMLCHFPNFFADRQRNRTLITFIDPRADVNLGYFRGRNPALLDLCRWRYFDSRDYLDNSLRYHFNPDECPSGPIYQPVFDGTDPMRSPDSPYLGANIDPDLMDVDWEFIKGEISNEAVCRYLRDCALDADSVTTVAVCLPVTSEAVSAALFMPEEVYKNPNVIQILVQQESTDAIIDAASKGVPTLFASPFDKPLIAGKYTKLKAFGMLDSNVYHPRLTSLLPAALHYIYSQAYSAITALGGLPEEKKGQSLDGHMTDVANYLLQAFRNPDGPEATAIMTEYLSIKNNKGKGRLAQMWSNVYNSLTVMMKCNFIPAQHLSGEPLSFTLSRPLIRTLAEVEHNRWNMEQILMGFRPRRENDTLRYGEYKNHKGKPIGEKDDLKIQFIHPDMHSYSERKEGNDPGLPEDTQLYDEVLTAMLPVLRVAILSLDTKTQQPCQKK